MKICVDELPKSCQKCPFYKVDTFVDVAGYTINSHECVLDGSMLTNNCPLQSLTDHDKQVRKEVCEDIIKLLPNYIYSFQEPDTPRTKVIELEDVRYILDQIQGEK